VWGSALALVVVLGFAVLPAAQRGTLTEVGEIPGNGPMPPSWKPGAVTVANGLQLLPVQGKVHMIAGAGGNIVVQAGDDGLFVVDTGRTDTSQQVLALLEQRFGKIIRFIVNTSADLDHVGGNMTLAGAGVAQNVREGAGGRLGGPPAGAQIYAHEKVMNRLSAPTGALARLPFGFWPTDTFFTDEKQLFFNGEAIQIRHNPAAHTDGDVVVFFRRSDVIAAGDVYSTNSYPVFDPAAGGGYQGVIDGLNQLLEFTIPDFNAEAGTYVVPGHGHVSDEIDVAEYRNMATIVRDRIQDLVKKGMTLQQVKAARPTLDYDGRYQKTEGEWTTDRFIEAVYREISGRAR
jgi:glyoxylase-like metal-dependent hydrolase (beta-lactamase superfamily II)